MFTLNQNQATAWSWVPRGTADIRESGLCIGVTRQTWNIPPLGASALEAWHNIPASQRHLSVPIQVPKGAICYGLHGQFGQPYYQFGHAWLAIGGGKCLSTDYGGRGTWTEQPVNLPRWTGVNDVTWSSWTPFGMLPITRATTPPPPPAHGYEWRQGKRVYGSKMHQNQTHSDSVWNLALALYAHKLLHAPTDSYTGAVVSACAAFQRSQGWKGKDANGIAGPITVARLGLVWAK